MCAHISGSFTFQASSRKLADMEYLLVSTIYQEAADSQQLFQLLLLLFLVRERPANGVTAAAAAVFTGKEGKMTHKKVPSGEASLHAFVRWDITTRPTLFIILELQNPSIDVSKVHKARQSTDFEALKL